MEVRFFNRLDAKAQAPVAVIGVFEGEKQLPAAVQALGESLGSTVLGIIEKEFKGEDNEWREITPEGGRFNRLFLLGLGKKEKLTPDRARRAAGNAQKKMDALKLPAYVNFVPASLTGTQVSDVDVYRAALEGACLASYLYRGMKTDKEPDRVKKVYVFASKEQEAAAKIGQTVAEGVNYSRNLINAPANRMTPTDLAEAARAMAKEKGVKIQVWDKARIEKERMQLLLGVSQGSMQEPRFVVMEYGKPVKGKGPLVFVGKGVTFDTGGISIKPANGMEKMKYDMAGSAAVIGVMHNIASLKLNGHFVGIFAATENMPGGRATKPGDVHDSRDGKTVEIINTDAEGRLILADALAYAKDFKPSAVVDAATLTGACVIALGDTIGLMGNNEDLMNSVKKSAEEGGERAWELPMWEEYGEGLKGEVSDLKNVSPGRKAGTITAAKFLEKFVDYPWVHLDIAGAAWIENNHPYYHKGAAGAAVRTFTRLAEKWFTK